MEGGLMEILCDIIRDALFEVVENLLKTENFKIRIEPGSKKGKQIIINKKHSNQNQFQIQIQMTIYNNPQVTISLESFIV